jgi:hypothetical protein
MTFPARRLGFNTRVSFPTGEAALADPGVSTDRSGPAPAGGRQ